MKNFKSGLKKKRSLQKIFGNLERPRLSVFRSNKHIYAQLIDDVQGQTLAFSSSLDHSLFPSNQSTSTKDASFIVGQDIAKKALNKKLEKVIFDRANRPYHGRIQSLAEGARKEGLIF
jgi:large subunit ribosomal protein L18